MKRKNAVISLVLVGVMFFSTFAYAILQSLYYSPTQQQEVSLPNAVSTQPFTSEQKQAVLQQGGTLVSFKYDITCLECGSTKSFLESKVRDPDYNQQVFLEELTGSKITQVDISSQRGSKTITNVTQDNITDSLCNLLLQQPLSCTLRKV
ncbi:hypothetical protein EPN87_04255 [archaeon]|nr:MAG: hypothetical protein EPN87_04255 [archaeon]